MPTSSLFMLGAMISKHIFHRTISPILHLCSRDFSPLKRVHSRPSLVKEMDPREVTEIGKAYGTE